MEKIRIAVIGCGASARTFFAPALKKTRKHWNTLYCVDTHRVHADALARTIPGAQVVSDYHEILSKVNYAIIAVPHFLHYQIAMDFLQKGVNVLCEKPLTESLDEARRLIEVSKATQTRLWVNNTRRLLPAFRGVRKYLASGEIGKPLALDFQEGNAFGWRSNGGFYVDPSISSKGVLLDIGAHAADLICWWLGGSPELIEYRDDSFGGPESTIYALGSVGSCRFELRLTRLVDTVNYYSIKCERGLIYGNPNDQKTFTLIRGDSRKTIHCSRSSQSYAEYVGDLASSFITGAPEEYQVRGEDIIDSLHFIDKCYKKRSRFTMAHCEDMEAFNEL